MDTQKLESLEEVTRLIQEKWGQDTVQTLKQYKAAYHFPTISSGIAELDAVIEGIPCSYMTLLHGSPTSGMTTLIYRLIAEAQNQGQVIVYLDLAETFDGEYAVLNCAVDTSRLLLIQPVDLLDALTLTRDVMALPYRGLIVLDAALIEIEPGVLTTGLERLRTPLRQSNWTVVSLLPPTALRLSQPYAALQILFRRIAWITTHDRVTGFQASIAILKHTSSSRQQSVIFTINPDGV